EPDTALRRGREHLVAYLGVMGPQDGVDLAVRAIAELVHGHGRTDTTFALIGDGDARADVVDLVRALGVEAFVDLPGRVPDDLLFRYLSTADVGLSPDPPSPLNDVSTMNKTMEYMAFGLPVVAFDLPETMVSGGDGAVYARGGDVPAFAAAVAALLDDGPLRRAMGAAARHRVETVLAWPHQAEAYVGVYDRLLGSAPTPVQTSGE
ncbi:MAG TPA: glycosyltransferase, partial [Acidimicrobiales bacterium]|nr:glycosyltransferase [Acidimicrobiales bacterium]